MNSPLGKVARRYPFVNLLELDLPTGKDGFLATNSLLAFSIILIRAYAAAFQQKDNLPQQLAQLLGFPSRFSEIRDRLRNSCLGLWEKETLVVLHSSSTRSAALDLESKFTEAALGNTQVSDYRNFAHGRHHWLAKRGENTGVLALITEDDEPLAEATLKLIPQEIKIVRIDVRGSGGNAILSSLVFVLLLVGLAGKYQGIDPGCPRVARFGRKLYNLDGFRFLPERSVNGLRRNEKCAIERKAGTEVEDLIRLGELEYWVKAYRSFITKLAKARFMAIALDFDGTLCDPCDRYTGLREDISKELIKLLDAGGMIGIATGRGKSVRESLRSHIPKSLWKQVLIGCYNGADIGLLNDDDHPQPSDEVFEPLKRVTTAIKASQTLSRLAKSTFRKYQITIEPLSHSSDGLVWDLASQLVRKVNNSGVTVLRSSHSIDIVASIISKQRIIDALKNFRQHNGSDAILCIGDRGKWPGNDFDLLSEPYSLSVDQVSSDTETCWNISPPGYRGVQATLCYLRALSSVGNVFRLSLHK